MKKYKITALPRMQEGGSKPKKKKSKYDIESTNMFTPEDDIYSDLYNEYSDETLETGETPSIEGFNKFFQDIAQEEGLYAVPRKNEDGNFSFETYNLAEISDKIYNQGIRPKQMAEKMNLGNIEDLERDFKPVLDFSKEQYMAFNKEAMFDLLDEGKSPEQAIDELYKKGMGTKEGLKNIFYDDAIKTQDEILKHYDKEMGRFLPEVFKEVIDEENKRASAANLEYDNVLDSHAVSDTFSPYSDIRYEHLGEDLGTESQASSLSEYGTALQDRYREIINDPDLSKASKIASLRDLNSLENDYAFTEEKKYDAEMEKAGMVRSPLDGEWMEPNHTVGGISDEDLARNNASWNIKNPYRKASMLTKFLHPIDALGHLAKYGNTDRMQEEDPSSDIWHDNMLMQGFDGVSYVTPGLGQWRAAQMIADGVKGLGNIAAYDYNTPNADINKMDFFAPAINLAFGKALGGKKLLTDGLKKGVKSVDRMISPSAARNFRLKPFTVNSSRGVNQGTKNYMSGTFDNPAFAGVGLESALLPLSFDDIAVPVMEKGFEKGYGVVSNVADVVRDFKDSAKDITKDVIGYAKGGITKGKSKIKGAGDGMFTTTGFKKGDVIGLAHRNDQPISKLGRMHNHNEEAPTMFSKKIGNERYVFANRDLEPGEELTTNYRLQPELEQPEDFQEGGANTIREIPIAQRGGRIVKTLAEIKNELPQVFGQMHNVKKMNPRDYSKFKDLTNLISTYAYSGIPASKEIFSQQQLDTFKSIQRDRARKALTKALNNDAVTKEDLVSILTQSQDGSALGRLMGTGTMDNKTFFKATPKPPEEIGQYSRRKFVEEEDNSYLRKISESLMNKSKDELKQAVLNTESNLGAYRQEVSNLVQRGMSPEEAIQHIFANKSPEVAAMLRNNPNYGLSGLLEKPSFTSQEKSIEEIMEGLKERNLFESAWREPYHQGFDASSLQTGEQIIGNFDDISQMQQAVKLKEGLGLLTQQGMPEETLALYARRLNEAFHRENPNSIITGSLDTSADSYPMQVKRVLRASSLRRAPKLGVSETPQFLGYHSMNHMGFLDKFIKQPALGISREEQQRIQAEFLQTQLSEIYDQAKIPVEQRLPIMQTPQGAGQTIDYKGRTFRGGDILLPQFGVLKKDVQWPEDHKRMLLQDGGSAGVAPPPVTYPEGFRTDPRAFRGQVPGKMIREQRKANKKLMDPGMGVYGVDLEREKGVPPYNFDKQSREQNREVRQNNRQARRDERPPRTGTSYPINQANKYTWFSKNIGQHFKGRTGKQRYGPKLGQSRKIKGMQDGGFVETELNQKEIDNLVKQGYIIEDV